MKVIEAQCIRKDVFKPFDVSEHKGLFGEEVQNFVSFLKCRIANENTRYTPGV